MKDLFYIFTVVHFYPYINYTYHISFLKDYSEMFNSYFSLKESDSYSLVNNLHHLKGRFLIEVKKTKLFFFYTAVASMHDNCQNSHKFSAASFDI